MADNTEKLVTLSDLSDHIEEIKRILKQVRAFIDKKDDTKVDKVSGKQLSTNDYTAAEKNKLATLKNYDDSALVAQVKALEQSLNTLVGNNASEAIDNFNEILRFLSGITDTQTLGGMLANIRDDMQTYLSQKVDKESGKQLSTNDYTTEEKNKLAGIESGAQKNTVTGIKGNAESSYRTGNVNLTPANIGAAEASHTHSIGNVTNLQAALDGKAASSHTHAISNITNLQTTLDGKAAKSHKHSASEITSGTLSMERIADKSITKEKLADGIFTDTDKILISTIYIDQTITDPASMISGDINGAAIQAIRANSHRYLGKYTAENTMTICQLDDTNSTLFTDGTAADLTGAQGDVFMRLPVFYTQAIELVEDRWQIKFAFGGQPGPTWKKWGGNDLIGVYEAYYSSSKIYSRSGVTPSTNISLANFKTYARNRGTGFTLVKHKHQNIMAFLFYALFGNTNAQEKCGYGTSSSSQTTGDTNSLGMTDTTTANGNSMSINFWGLEKWWGGLSELEDNVICNSNTWNITEDDGTTRQVTGYSVSKSDWYFPRKFVIGDNLDTIMKPNSVSGSVSDGYCVGNYLGIDDSMVVSRSCISEYGGFGGVVSALIGGYSSDYSNTKSSRLAFAGNIIEEENTETFKSLTAIG